MLYLVLGFGLRIASLSSGPPVSFGSPVCPVSGVSVLGLPGLSLGAVGRRSQVLYLYVFARGALVLIKVHLSICCTATPYGVCPGRACTRADAGGGGREKSATKKYARYCGGSFMFTSRLKCIA